MSGRRRCCCRCPEYVDLFARADSPRLGAPWIHENGWDLYGQTARVQSPADGPALYGTGLPDPDGSMVAVVSFFEAQLDDTYDVIVAAEDEDNYLFARFTAPSTFDPGDWKQCLGKVSGGIETILVCDDDQIGECPPQLQPYLYGSSRDVLVHYDGTMLTIGGSTMGFGHYELSTCTAAPSGVANKAGLGHGGGPRPVRFGAFRVIEHRRTNPACPDYGCRCKWDHCANPTGYMLSLTRIGGNYGLPDCQEVPEYLDVPLTKVNATESVWRSPRVIPCLGSVQEDSYRQFFLECLQGPRQTLYKLHVVDGIYDYTEEVCGPEWPSGTGATEWTPIRLECDPFMLVYRNEPGQSFGECCWDPYEEPGPHSADWEYEAVITEVEP
jgi:hypothetical protein